LSNSKSSEIKKIEEEVDTMQDAFPDLVFAEEEDEDIEVKEEEDVFFLWDTLEEFFNLYVILKDYNSANYEINSAIMLKLIEEDGLPIKKTITLIPYCHSGYISSIQPRVSDNGGDK
jgi:hypothetical protein